MVHSSDRIRGGILGALVGDALGVPVEFSSRSERRRDPVREPRGFGCWNQPPGTWSDDGALLLCTAEAILDGADLDKAGELFLRWWKKGYRTARGTVFDIGGATLAALNRISNGTPAAQAGGTDESDNGNGSLMRILPIAWRFCDEPAETVVEHAMSLSSVTHRHPRSQLACAYLCLVVRQLMHREEPFAAWRNAVETMRPFLRGHPAEANIFARVASDDFPSLPESEIESGGYVIHTLEAALWCLLKGGQLEDIVLRAINLGGDTDTTGCVAGGLAGTWLGESAIPSAWLSSLPDLSDIRKLCRQLSRE
ncbi:MAG: ADP-ribosylglycohydrolase family protein [Opitutaceae bacterium]|nr:ADP-ribosylglycohydrolase family protein [Opitutaceae bacterium]